MMNTTPPPCFTPTDTDADVTLLHKHIVASAYSTAYNAVRTLAAVGGRAPVVELLDTMQKAIAMVDLNKTVGTA
jgi:hypothetical protein